VAGLQPARLAGIRRVVIDPHPPYPVMSAGLPAGRVVVDRLPLTRLASTAIEIPFACAEGQHRARGAAAPTLSTWLSPARCAHDWRERPRFNAHNGWRRLGGEFGPVGRLRA
jgi:hypothetical protein